MTRGGVYAAALIAVVAMAGTAVVSQAYFHEEKTSPQPISVADLAPPVPKIKYESASPPTYIDAVNVTVQAPPGVQPGWLLVAVIGLETDDPIVTAPAGWTLIRASLYSGGQVSMHSYWHVATAADPPSYTFTLDRKKRSYAGIVAYSGVTAANPITGSASTQGHSAAAPAPQATANGYETRWIFATTFDGKDPLIFSPDVTKRWAIENQGGEATGVADAALAASATTPPATVQSNSQEWVAQTIVLNAAP